MSFARAWVISCAFMWGRIAVAVIVLVRILWGPGPPSSDDFRYMASAAALELDASWAAIYCLWLHPFTTLPFAYLANWVVLTAALLVLTWRLLRRLGSSETAAVVGVAVMAVTGVCDLYSHVHVFSTVLIAIGVLSAASVAERWRMPVIACALALAAFVRPELIIASVVAMMSCSWRAIVPGALLGALLLALGSPLDGSRSTVAFGQHYAFNKALAGADHNPWHDWEHVLREDFGATVGPLAAARANPSRFAWHVSQNVMHLPRAAQILAPMARLRRSYKTPVAAVVFVFVLLGVWRGWRRVPGFVWITGLCIFAPVALSALLIHPRGHYFAALAFLAIVMAARGLDPAEDEPANSGALPGTPEPACAFEESGSSRLDVCARPHQGYTGPS